MHASSTSAPVNGAVSSSSRSYPAHRFLSVSFASVRTVNRLLLSTLSIVVAGLFAQPSSARADVRTGSWSARATLGGATWTQIYGTANVSPNTNYTASIWVKGSGTMHLIVNNPQWNYFPASTTVTATNTWTQITLPTFNSGNNTQLVLRFYDDIGSSSGSMMYIDDGFLGVSGGSNLLGNPGFESGDTGWTKSGTAFSIGQYGTSGPPLANGTYTLAPSNASSLRLDVTGSGTSNGTNVQVYNSSGGANQQWILTNISGNVYRLSPAHASAQCLDVSGQSGSSGTNVQIWQYLSQQNQRWALTAVSGGYTLTPQHATSLRLNATGTSSGSNVNVTTANSSSAQTWIVAPVTPSVPPAPTGLSATPGNAQVSLSWNASAGATSYNVYRGTSSNGQSSTPIATNVTNTNYTNTGLTNGTTYYYKARAVNSAGTSGNSSEASATPTSATETVGGGTLSNPAVGPAASYGLGSGYTLVKNWNFGSSGTVKNMTDMSTHFQYHDQFNTIANGSNYGALMVAPNSATAINDGTHGPQPVENGGSVPVTRSFTSDSLRTFLVPLNFATTISATQHNVGCGSFVAKWTLPNGGSLLNQDLIWETRVRYVTPPYFWFAIWTAGNQWNNGAEMDVVESFGYDNGGGNTNYDGRYWHSNSVGGNDTLVPNFLWDWSGSMASRGITSFDPTQYHIWQWVYRKNNTYEVYVDGILVQAGTINWRLGGTSGGTPINMSFLFDGGWGHTQVSSVNHSMSASQLNGKYYEWDYSRVYLRP